MNYLIENEVRVLATFVLILTCFLVYFVFNLIFGPTQVTIDARNFVCTNTSAVGIEAVCTQYTKTTIKH